MEQSYDPGRVTSSSFASRKRPELMHWTMAGCEQCDLLFATNPPDLDHLRSAYADASFDAGRESKAAAATYVRLVDRALGQDVRSHRLLDVGCGDGAFLEGMDSQGALSVDGIEISEAPIRRASPQIQPRIHQCMVEDFEGDGFTVATTFQVLEHFADPVAVLAKLHGVLVEDGVVMGVAHDRDAVVNRLLGRRSPIWDIEHLQLFNPCSLRALVREAGFRMEHIAPFKNAYPGDYWLRLAPVPAPLSSPLETTARRILGERNIPVAVGNLFFVARKT